MKRSKQSRRQFFLNKFSLQCRRNHFMTFRLISVVREVERKRRGHTMVHLTPFFPLLSLGNGVHLISVFCRICFLICLLIAFGGGGGKGKKICLQMKIVVKFGVRWRIKKTEKKKKKKRNQNRNSIKRRVCVCTWHWHWTGHRTTDDKWG